MNVIKSKLICILILNVIYSLHTLKTNKKNYCGAWHSSLVAKSSPCICRDPIWLPLHAQLFHFPFSSVLVAWKSNGGWPQTLEPWTHMGDPEEASGSWFWVGPGLAIVATWGVNQWTEDLSLCLSFLLYFCISNKNKIKLKANVID